MRQINDASHPGHHQPDEFVTLDWRGVKVAIRHWPHWLGNDIAHLEIASERPERAPLPITETGFLSHFLPTGEIEKCGGAEAYVLDWLESEAQFDDWQNYVARARQLSLF